VLGRDNVAPIAAQAGTGNARPTPNRVTPGNSDAFFAEDEDELFNAIEDPTANTFASRCQSTLENLFFNEISFKY
jgi:hypothetical protein